MSRQSLDTGRLGGLPAFLHAVLVAGLYSASPILSLLATNFEVIDPRAAIRALVVAVAAAIVLVVVLRLILRDWARASLLAAGLLLLFFSYGHVYDLLRHVTIAGL